jgi:exodeoxyribonuclease VII large subunit
MSTLPLFDPLGGGGDDAKVYRVSQLNRAVRGLLERRFASVWVAGEISDFTLPASGHAYFTLNDEDEPAQLRVVMFRTDARRSKARLENGARVKVQGQLSLFTPRGSYQLIARLALPEGLGELHAQFERVRQKLEAEGLLDPARKRALPKLPRVLGVVTSGSGAALHDIIQVAHGRCPLRIVISPCAVQGSEAPRSIVRALQLVQMLPELDAVIIGRGGGAAEDLLAFNDERVARAIAACRVPTISAVGHEVDISIADLVADVRAATPSNAAELAVPERRALLAELLGVERNLMRASEVRLGRARLRLSRLSQRLRDPSVTLHSTRRHITAARAQLAARLQLRIRRERARLAQLSRELARVDPRMLLALRRQRLNQLSARLLAAARPLRLARRQRLNQLQATLLAAAGPLQHARRERLQRLIIKLDALSPLASLARGYAIVLHADSGKALVSASQAAPGDALRVRLHKGELRARVERS